MLTTLRRCIHLFGASRRSRWMILVVLAIAVGVFEALGAVLIYSLLTLVTSSEVSSSLPVLGELLEGLEDTADRQRLWLMITVIGTFFIIRGALFLLQSYARSRAAHNAGATLATRLLIGYLEMPYAFHLQRNSSELIRNTQYSVMDLVMHAFIPTVSIASEGLLVGGIVAALVATAPFVTFLMMGVLAPLVFILMKLVQPRLQNLGQVNQDMMASNVKILQQGFEGVRDIQLAGAASFFRVQFEQARFRLAASLYRKELIQDIPRVAIETLVFLFVLAFVAISIVTRGGINQAIPVLGLFVYAVFRVLPSLNRILSGINILRFGFAAIDHVYDDVVAIEQAARPAPTVAAIALTEKITIDKLSFSYNHASRPVLSNVDLEIRHGESIGFVGTTGSGKSTLVDLVIGLLEPDSGSIRVDGVDIRQNLSAWHSQIGMVPQTVFLLDDTLRNNIAFGVDPSEIDADALREAVRMAQLDDFVQSLPIGLDTIVGERGVRVSGGQRQRVAIARALYRRPQLLVLDEGTSALDNETESRLMQALNELRGERTIVLIAHRLTTVRACDRIVLLRSGRVEDVGSYDELLQRNLYFRNLAS